MKRNLTIGTRRSQLALWQANYVADALRRHDPELSVQLQQLRETQEDDLLRHPWVQSLLQHGRLTSLDRVTVAADLPRRVRPRI